MSKQIGLGIVTSEFNFDITKLMEEKAVDHAKFLGARVVKVIRVPGTFDMPLAVKKLLDSNEVDAVVTLGAVIEGETEHDEVVAHQAARKLMDLSVSTGKPVALGFTGPGASRTQAVNRLEEYARRSVESAVKMCQRLSE